MMDVVTEVHHNKIPLMTPKAYCSMILLIIGISEPGPYYLGLVLWQSYTISMLQCFIESRKFGHLVLSFIHRVLVMFSSATSII